MGEKEERLVESVLFSASQPITLAEIKETTGLTPKKITDALDSLMTSYDKKNDTSIEIVKAGDKYTMQIKKKYVDKSIMITQPEIDGNLLKTLTLIAFHQPVKQSNLRRMIGQKAYEHVDELADLKLIHSRKHGSTEMLTTTKLFPEYFGLETTDPEEIRDLLAKKVAGTISKKE